MDFLNYFGKHTMNQYPRADKRRYSKIVPYRDFYIAKYEKDDRSEIFEINGMPICEVFFVLDDMEDNLLPVDTCLSSYFHATGAIDLYKRICEDKKWRTRYPTTSTWGFVQENFGAARAPFHMVDFMRDIRDKLHDFDASDDFGESPAEFLESIKKDVELFFKKLGGWRPSQTLGSDGKAEDDSFS